MGTLSGGGTEVISVGKRCLVGANAGLGISLGDDCVVEAGCYVTAGTKVTVKDLDGKPQVVKAARALGGRQRALPPQLRHRDGRGRAVAQRRCRAQRRAARQLSQTRFTARAATTATVVSAVAEASMKSSLKGRLRGIASVGLNAVDAVKATNR